MKIGMNLLLWTGQLEQSHAELLRDIRWWGYDGVEIPLNAPAELDVDWAAQEVKQCGLQVTTVTALPQQANLIGDSEWEQHTAIGHLRACIQVTRRLGASLLCGPLYSPVGRLAGRPRTAREWRRAVANLGEVARIAADNGVRLALEPLNRFETYFLNTLADTLALVEETGSESLGVQLDTFHANIEEKDVAEATRACGRRLYHVHVSDNDRGICGSGHVDWDGIFAALQEIGYDGWVVVESFSQTLPQIAAATAMWRPVAPSPTVYAQESLKFLRAKAGLAARPN
jgi:D-psicose/D-tagatose/L-ribulose 3-epimerase